jgi:hypothetical protein
LIAVGGKYKKERKKKVRKKKYEKKSTKKKVRKKKQKQKTQKTCSTNHKFEIVQMPYHTRQELAVKKEFARLVFTKSKKDVGIKSNKTLNRLELFTDKSIKAEFKQIGKELAEGKLQVAETGECERGGKIWYFCVVDFTEIVDTQCMLALSLNNPYVFGSTYAFGTKANRDAVLEYFEKRSANPNLVANRDAFIEYFMKKSDLQRKQQNVMLLEKCKSNDY